MFARTLAFTAAFMLGLTCLASAPVQARPPGPGWHPPAPAPHYRHHHRHYGWLWAPAIAGATIWGLSTLYDNAYDGYVPYRYRVAPSYVAPPYVGAPYYSGYAAAASAEQSAIRAEAAASAAQAAASSVKTLYWCEAEKGFYPHVRACPTGWTPVPAP